MLVRLQFERFHRAFHMHRVRRLSLNVEKNSIQDYQSDLVIGVGLLSFAVFYFHLLVRKEIYTVHTSPKEKVFIVIFFPVSGILAFCLALKAQIKYEDGFLDEARKLNKRALVLSIVSVICGVAVILGCFYGLDSWPRSNG